MVLAPITERKRYDQAFTYGPNALNVIWVTVQQPSTLLYCIANIFYFKCKYLEHTSRGSKYTLAHYLGLCVRFN